MKVQVPVIVKDPEVSRHKGVHPTEPVEIDTEDRYLDGPISPRVAVLDFEPKSGQLAPGVKFLPPARLEDAGSYQIDEPVTTGGQVSREAGAVSLFGAIHKTIKLFEEEDALGRPIAWGFDSPQLLAIPRAGDLANAFYERASHSVQFFSFDTEGTTVFTGHSQDIVAHETAHAIFDGVAPDLYDALTPQSLAIHESVADLTAVLCALRSEELVRGVVEGGGTIYDSNVFSGIAEQFAGALDNQRDYLRNLNNTKSLQTKASASDRVDRRDPHDLSQVLSGALYQVLIHIFEELQGEYHTKDTASQEIVESEEADYSVAQARQYAPDKSAGPTPAIKALWVAGQRFKRTLYRGLDYLPPGDVTFADLGRTVLAADKASHPGSSRQREHLVKEFLARGIVSSATELDAPTNFEHPSMKKVDLDDLINSNYIAYSFVNDNRQLLNIPSDVTFEVRPRLSVTRSYWHRDGKQLVSEVLLKVRWTETELGNVAGLPRKRRIDRGTTLAIEVPPAGSKTAPLIRTVVTTGRSDESKRDRTEFLKLLVDAEVLRLGDEAVGPTGKLLRGAVRGDVRDGALKISGTNRFLHVTGEPRR
ncbi:MAG: hypothetical protein ACRDWA_03050 [Acidimicrobiia bacterium]